MGDGKKRELEDVYSNCFEKGSALQVSIFYDCPSRLLCPSATACFFLHFLSRFNHNHNNFNLFSSPLVLRFTKQKRNFHFNNHFQSASNDPSFTRRFISFFRNKKKNCRKCRKNFYSLLCPPQHYCRCDERHFNEFLLRSYTKWHKNKRRSRKSEINILFRV